MASPFRTDHRGGNGPIESTEHFPVDYDEELQKSIVL